MAIVQHTFHLLDKKQLTHDVFELTFHSDTAAIPKPGQYILFHLPSGLKRAYSIAFHDGNSFIFIIKRIPFDGAGSREICDLTIGQEISGMGPIGHFTLTDGDIPRLFIGTGTGFAPLYFQIRALESRHFSAQTQFLFGVRNEEDIFFQDEFARLTESHSAFSFTQYLSQGVTATTTKGYVTDGLTQEFIGFFQEFYICGSPVMVKSARDILTGFSIPKEAIKFEQY